MTSNINKLRYCLSYEGEFPHRKEVLEALSSGATIRQEDRLITAESHFGTYSIRLRIVTDEKLTKGNDEEANTLKNDITYFLKNLQKNLSGNTQAWHVRCSNGERFTIIEDNETGELLGCLYGKVLPNQVK